MENDKIVSGDKTAGCLLQQRREHPDSLDFTSSIIQSSLKK